MCSFRNITMVPSITEYSVMHTTAIISGFQEWKGVGFCGMYGYEVLYCLTMAAAEMICRHVPLYCHFIHYWNLSIV